jgi:hypothetical protein
MRNEFPAVVEQEGSWYIADSRTRTRGILAIATSRRTRGTRCDRMKRERLLRHLRRYGCIVRRARGRNTLQTLHAETIPGHRETANLQAKRMCHRLSGPDTPGEVGNYYGTPTGQSVNELAACHPVRPGSMKKSLRCGTARDGRQIARDVFRNDWLETLRTMDTARQVGLRSGLFFNVRRQSAGLASGRKSLRLRTSRSAHG